jgi:hypothetical protein
LAAGVPRLQQRREARTGRQAGMLMTVDRAFRLRRKGHLVRVLLDGLDVTRDCRCAGKGWALLLLRDDQGRPYRNEHRTGVVEHIVTGDVVVQVRLWAAKRGAN